MKDQNKDKNEIKFEFNLKSTINAINKHGKITVRTATILAENLGEILKTYKKDLNFDQLVRESFKLEDIIKPSEYLGRYRIYKDKKYSKKTYERLSKDPKKYLLLVERIISELDLKKEEENLIKKLVQKTKFENPNIEDDDEFFDFEPLEKINEIIRKTSNNIIKEFDLEEYCKLKITNKIEMIWENSNKAENKYRIQKTDFPSSFISMIPIYEKFFNGATCQYIENIKGVNQSEDNFLFFGERVSFAVIAEKQIINKNNEYKNKVIINPKIVVQPFYFSPGFINEKKKETPSLYFFNLGTTPQFLKIEKKDNIFDLNGKKIKGKGSGSILPQRIEYCTKEKKLSFNKNLFSAFDKFGQPVEMFDYSFCFKNDFTPTFMPFSNHFEQIGTKINEVSNINKLQFIDFKPNFYDIDSYEWFKILKAEKTISSRPGLALSNFFSMELKTLIASQEGGKDRVNFSDSVYSQILSSILKLGPTELRNHNYQLISDIEQFIDNQCFDRENQIHDHVLFSDDDNLMEVNDDKFLQAEILFDDEPSFNRQESDLRLNNYIDIYPFNEKYDFGPIPSYYEELNTGIVNFLEMTTLDIKRKTNKLKKILYEEKSFLNIMLEQEINKQIRKNKKLKENDD